MLLGTRCLLAGALVLATGLMTTACGPEDITSSAFKVASDLMPDYEFQIDPKSPAPQEAEEAVDGESQTAILVSTVNQPYAEIAKKLEKVANGLQKWALLTSSTGKGFALKCEDYRGYMVLIDVQRGDASSRVVLTVTK